MNFFDRRSSTKVGDILVQCALWRTRFGSSRCVNLSRARAKDYIRLLRDFDDRLFTQHPCEISSSRRCRWAFTIFGRTNEKRLEYENDINKVNIHVKLYLVLNHTEIIVVEDMDMSFTTILTFNDSVLLRNWYMNIYYNQISNIITHHPRVLIT